MPRCSFVEAQEASRMEHDGIMSLHLRGSVEICGSEYKLQLITTQSPED